MLQIKVVFKKVYKFYIEKTSKMLLNSRELKFLKNYRNVYGKSSAKGEYPD